jgi:hypothetical protein
MKKMIRVKNVQVIEDYKLILDFSNGEKKLFDYKPLLEKNDPLRNKGFFSQAKAEYGTVIWTEDIDICPEILYEKSIPYEA